MVQRFVVSALLVFLATALPAEAAGLKQEDILGKWCGAPTNSPVTNLTFSRDTLIVMWRSDGSTKRYRVEKIEVEQDSIIVYWERDGKSVSTEYSIFDKNKSTMNQIANEKGPRYAFTRC